MVETRDLLVEVHEALLSDLLPRIVVVGIKNSLYVVQRQAGILEHLHEHHTTQCRPSKRGTGGIRRSMVLISRRGCSEMISVWPVVGQVGVTRELREPAWRRFEPTFEVVDCRSVAGA